MDMQEMQLPVDLWFRKTPRAWRNFPHSWNGEFWKNQECHPIRISSAYYGLINSFVKNKVRWNTKLKRVCKLRQFLTVLSPYDLAVKSHSIYPKQLKKHIYAKSLHKDVYNSSIHNCPNLEATKMSFSRWTDKQTGTSRQRTITHQ